MNQTFSKTSLPRPKALVFLTFLALLLTAGPGLEASDFTNFSDAVVVLPETLSPVGQKAVDLLLDEIEKRTFIELGTAVRADGGRPEIRLGISPPSKPSSKPTLPAEATQDGELTLSWNQAPGGRGNGRGCQVAEVWLLKKEGN